MPVCGISYREDVPMAKKINPIMVGIFVIDALIIFVLSIAI
jgi:hypothetical protein